MTEQPKHKPPHGMEPYDLGGGDDLGALSKEQQQKLNDFKKKTRVENEKYLRDHPEVECLLSGFLGEVLKERPENIRDFAADHFTNTELPGQLQKTLEIRQARIKQNRILQKI
ncbi:RIIa domain-containing protein 1-like [Mytilus californianus]|uniref:RIIa domain-containing protein 1-like n=1 Tax=Mytilus californianus TaxID=6549 RepID=UPI002247A72E|nr:RIIa domain-containing protein 1-like [Mytilus californianus]